MSTVLRCTDWRTFAISIGKSTPETNINRAAHFFGTLTPLGIPLLPQGMPSHYSRFRGADRIRPGWLFFRLRRLSLLSGVGIIGSICVGIVAQFIIDTPFVDNPPGNQWFPK